MIENPILPGANPDPAICRAGDDFYIACSTFEWFPGVQIHHSRDLVHWRLVGQALNRTSQLTMIGDPDSGGVWAPCLTFADGKFWLVYSDTKTWRHGFKDVHNYVVWTDDIESGEWSEPHFLNSSGFDPSLFHDDDGRRWVSNQLWDHRAGQNSFAGIVLQEYDHEAGRLVGPITNIFTGTSAKFTEGSHLYKKNGWYYLVTAEGGTFRHHCVSVARSRTLTGPYEVHPENPILTARHDLGITLQRAGHASWCDTPSGEWYLAHLASRPIHGHSLLGRETSLQKLAWGADEWPRLAAGGCEPQNKVPAPNLPACPQPQPAAETTFPGPGLPPEFQTLRIPADDTWVTFEEAARVMRLAGQESLASRHRTSLVARRVQHFDSRAETTVDINPDDFQHMAGLVALYDVASWFYLHVSRDAERGRELRLASMNNGVYGEDLSAVTSLPDAGPVDLACEIVQMEIRFYFRADGATWQPIGRAGDANRLSDEYGDYGAFTGAFVGMACQDLSGRRREAGFSRFLYRGLRKGHT